MAWDWSMSKIEGSITIWSVWSEKLEGWDFHDWDGKFLRKAWLEIVEEHQEKEKKIVLVILGLRCLLAMQVKS